MTYGSESECAIHYTTAPHNVWHRLSHGVVFLHKGYYLKFQNVGQLSKKQQLAISTSIQANVLFQTALIMIVKCKSYTSFYNSVSGFILGAKAQ